MRLPTGDFFQVCWVVTDLHAAMRQWHEVRGVGPFYYVEHLKMDEYAYRGVPGDQDLSMAVAQAGSFQLELLIQHCDTPSAVRDMYKRGQGGLHHMATRVPDFEGTIAHYKRHGFDMIQKGAALGVVYCFIDTRAAFGHMVEVFDGSKAESPIRKLAADAARDWDGRDPYRKAG